MQLQITRVAGGSAPGVASLQRAARPQRAAAAPSRQRAVAVKAGLLDFFNQVGRRAAAAPLAAAGDELRLLDQTLIPHSSSLGVITSEGVADLLMR